MRRLGVMGDSASATGIDDAEISNCHVFARMVAAFRAVRCAYVEVRGMSVRAGRALLVGSVRGTVGCVRGKARPPSGAVSVTDTPAVNGRPD